MQMITAKAEILVRRTFEWWTFLALITDPLNPFAELSFVPSLSPSATTAILDLSYLSESLGALHDKTFLILILWDGYQSYHEQEALIERASHLVGHLELRPVGDMSNLEANPHVSVRPLFSQHNDTYTPRTVREGLRRVHFGRPFAALNLKHRSTLISFKVLLQLIGSRRWAEYKRTRFVYCGHSGLAALAQRAPVYGMQPDEIPVDIMAEICVPELVARWLAAFRRNRGHWMNPTMLRGLLRFLALRALSAYRKPEIFLNIFPEPNINVYQAGMLFTNHIFLDFGGSHGDETIYPRSADLLVFQREVIRFEFKTAASELMRIEPDNFAGIAQFIDRYQVAVLLQLDSLATART
jgi:hypothetical protein